MKKSIVYKDGGWAWPISDENSWKYQNEYSDLVNYILPHLKNKTVMVQAGGNCGYILNTFVNHFDYIYTFEPDPINFYCLNQNITSRNVIKMQSCLGNNNKPVNVQQLIRPDRPNDAGGVHIAGNGYIPSIKIDDLNLTDCNLIQLDVEGYEYNILKGAIDTIKRCKPIIVIEDPAIWLKRYNASVLEFTQFLQSLNYIKTRVLSNNDIMYKYYEPSNTSNFIWNKKLFINSH
jgi:FkbM family methyltransferase